MMTKSRLRRVGMPVHCKARPAQSIALLLAAAVGGSATVVSVLSTGACLDVGCPATGFLVAGTARLRHEQVRSITLLAVMSSACSPIAA